MSEIGNDQTNDSSRGGDNGLIVPMDTGSIQRIVAGQAVTDLASAVKELVDNALDAGAKTINIRLFNQGMDVLEVSDDGSGVPLSSRPFLARKHATSKIRNFHDIYQNQTSTLGFRGEALFCLANLSEKLVIVTRTKEDSLGQQLEFGQNGELLPQSTSMTPRKVGTTVAVGKLFAALPVRRADLVKRIKAQRAKVVSMMQGYAILCLGVRFNLIDVIKTKNSYREEIKLSTTNASTKVEQTVSSILGSRFLSGMTRISIDLGNAIDTATTGTRSQDGTISQWKVEGLVSKAPSLTARDGSVAREAQFFSINGRPVELPKVSRAISDAWRAFEGTKKRPACVLCFTLPNNEYDVNLSPDKREVLLTHSDNILSVIHAAVTKLWTSQNGGNFAENAVQVVEKAQPQQREQAAANTQETATFTEAVPRLESNQSPPEASPGKRRRFRRRNAFVHDPGMARLQHEEDDYERREHSQQQHPPPVDPPPPSAASAVSPADVQAVTNESRQTGSANQSAESTAAPQATPRPDEVEARSTNASADEPSPLPTGRRERPSNDERRQWASVQSTFNAASRHYQRDEIQALDAQQQRQQQSDPGQPISPEEGTPMQQDSPPTNAATNAEAPATKRSRTFTLEDFAFRPANKTSKPSGTTSSSTQNPSTVPKHAATTGKKNKTAPQPKDDEIDSRKRFGVSLTDDQQRHDDRRKRQKSSEAQQDEKGSRSDESNVATHERQAASEPETTLVWNSFDGTDAVMKATKDARFSMRSFRKELRAISKRSSSGSSNENDAVVCGIDDDGTVTAADSGDATGQVEESSSNVVSLSKEDFRHMQVIGQFNLGFILAKCRNNHLWILDQHACDEKYNFERLCTTTVIHEQKLIAPMPLELSPSEESCILENMAVFEENGFRFAHDPSKPPRHRLSLTALPHSGAQDGRKAVQFGKDDVHALCAMLSTEEEYSQDGGTGADGSGMYGNNAVRRHAGVSQTQQGRDTATKVIARLPKAIAMFANRACRGSIMIGTALSQKEMDTIVKRLADVDNPWSCPHGRPTMRHVQNLMDVMKDDEARATSLVAGPTMAVMTQMTQQESLSQEQGQDDS